jgi:geranylgeranyl pyrophosphate synthase
MIALMKESLEVLGTKSAKALEIARQQLLTYKIENENLVRALEYYAENWDDTIHPGVIALACEGVGGDEQKSLPVQVPTLLLTAAVDVHDDILDGSEIKNEKPTLLGKFGKGVALLVGDGMLLKGMSMFCNLRDEFPSETAKEIVSTIEKAFVDAGNAHAIEAGYMQKTDLQPEEYLEVLKKKSSILGAHTTIGALAGGGRKDEVEALGDYGRILGTLITLRDETIDVFEIQELNDRMRNGCLPLPLLYAFKNPKTKKEILEILNKPRPDEEDAGWIVDMVFEEETVKSLTRNMKTMAERASQLISNLPEKSNLELLISSSLEDL